MFEFVGQVIRDFWAASALEKAGFLLSLAGLSTFVGAIFSLFRLRDSRALIDQLRKDAVILATERDTAEKRADSEKARAELYIPDRWIAAADREISQGNDIMAANVLREGFERVREGICHACIALAGHSLSSIVESNSDTNLNEAERFARLASILDPTDEDAVFLVEDVELIRADGSWADMPMLPASYRPSQQDEAVAVIEAIQLRGHGYVDRGRYRIARRFFQRALLIAKRADLAGGKIGIYLRYKIADCLVHLGKHEEALEEVIRLIRAAKTNMDRGDPWALALETLRANILFVQQKYQEAYDSVESAISRFAPLLGKSHEMIMNARGLQVALLPHISKPESALTAIRRLLPLFSKELGPHNQNTIALLYQEGYCLVKLGKSREALDKINRALPLQEQALGVEHPSLLQMRKLQAECMYYLDDVDGALRKLAALIPVMERVYGGPHPHLDIAKGLQARIFAGQ